MKLYEDCVCASLWATFDSNCIVHALRECAAKNLGSGDLAKLTYPWYFFSTIHLCIKSVSGTCYVPGIFLPLEEYSIEQNKNFFP